MTNCNLNLIINLDQSYQIENTSNNKTTTRRIYHIELNKRRLQPKDLPIKHKIDKVDVIFTNTNSTSHAQLSNKIKTKLMELLAKGRPDSNFDGHSFISYIFNKYSETATSLQAKDWTRKEFDQNKLSPGTAVHLLNGESGKHSALYLGKDQYLSVFGINGPYCVTTLKEMETFFDSNETYILQPKK